MVLVFILLVIFILVLAISFTILISTLHIEIKNLEITNMNSREGKQDDINIEKQYLSQNNVKFKKQNTPNYAIILSLCLINKFKWISIHLNDEKMRKMYNKMQLEKIDLKKLEKDFKWENLKIIKKLQPKLSYLKLKTEVGTESPVITAFLVAIFSSLIAIFLPHLAIDMKEENYRYEILPVYQNKNLYKIQFSCIIQVKMVHIINVMYVFFKKGKSDLNERTTSNRRTYGYSHE